MAVTAETKPGTMTEEEERKKISSSTKDKTPAGKEVSPEEDQPIFTRKQAEALVHAKDSEWGRKYKDIEKERDSLKSQVDNELAANAEDIKKLEEKLEDLSKDDPARFDAVKEMRIAREERRQLKADRLLLETEKKDLEPDREERRNREIFSIALEYEVDNYDKLFELCEISGAKSEEQIRKMADTIWKKKGAEEDEEEGKPKTPKAPKPYSGKSGGGTPYFTRAQIADRKFWEANKEAILKAQTEGRIRD